MKTVCPWSDPRHVSTAVLISFAQSPDAKVVDGPLGRYVLMAGRATAVMTKSGPR